MDPKGQPCGGARSGGGCWMEMRVFVGPGPLVCGALLISTGCAKSYVSGC